MRSAAREQAGGDAQQGHHRALQHGQGGGDADQSFNGIQLELTWEDLERLERDIKAGTLPETSGFFFGEDADDYYRNQDLEFIKQARAEIFLGLRVFYNSSW